MRVLWCSLLSTGSGHVFIPAAACNALRRRNIDADFRVLHGTEFGWLAQALRLDATRLEHDTAEALLGPNRYETALYRNIEEFAPDVLIVEGSWFVFHELIHDIDAYKVGVFSSMLPGFFHINAAGRELRFDGDGYDRVFATEPFAPPFPAEHLNPVLLRNPEEIFPREESARRLGIDPNRETAFIALNGRPGEFENLKKTYSYLEDEYQVVYSSNYHGGIFPALDYYNASDVVVCGGGYSQFWEAVYYKRRRCSCRSRAGSRVRPGAWRTARTTGSPTTARISLHE